MFAEADVWTSGGAVNQAKWTLFPKQNETLVYDADGNLTQDSLWIYTWDGENRLIAMENKARILRIQRVGWHVGNAPEEAGFRVRLPGPPHQQTGIYLGVLPVRALAFSLQPSAFLFTTAGSVIAILDANRNPVASFTWGLDLSGSLQGAGGVGGLLIRRHYGSTNLYGISRVRRQAGT